MIIFLLVGFVLFMLMWIVAFFHAMIRIRRDKRALQNNKTNDYEGIHDPEVLKLLKECDELLSNLPLKNSL